MNRFGTIPLRNPLVRSRQIRGSMFEGHTVRAGSLLGMSHSLVVTGTPNFTNELIGIPAGDPYQVTVLSWFFRDFQIYATSASDILELIARLTHDTQGTLFEQSSGLLQDGNSQCLQENMHDLLKPNFNFAVDGIAGTDIHTMAFEVDKPAALTSCGQEEIRCFYFFHFPETEWYDVEIGTQLGGERQIYPSPEPPYPHSLVFDGQNDVMLAPLQDYSEDEFTVEFLFKSEVEAIQAMMGTSNAGINSVITVQINRDGSAGGGVQEIGNLTVWCRDESANEFRFGFQNNPGINDGEWHRISFSKDTNDNVNGYIDGQPEPLAFFVNEPLGLFNFNNPIGFGGRYAGNDDTIKEHFDGFIGDVRFWNVPRTAQEIQDTAFEKLEGDEPGLFEYYPFTTGRGTIARAQVNSEHNASISGAQWSSDTPIGA